MLTIVGQRPRDQKSDEGDGEESDDRCCQKQPSDQETGEEKRYHNRNSSEDQTQFLKEQFRLTSDTDTYSNRTNLHVN